MVREFKKGFTLAEVLITLLIIGVISSIVIPGIINNTNEAEYNVGVKKAYSDLSDAIKMIQVNNGGEVKVGTAAANTDMTLFRNDFCSVMSCIKTDTATNIFGPTDYKLYKGGSAGWPASEANPSAILSNGNLLRFYSYATCTYYGVKACGSILIDINGKKGPNMLGRDFYRFWITQKDGNSTYVIIPTGAQGDTYVDSINPCKVNSSTWPTSEGCTAKRLTDPDNMP
ncbi:MAG: prepilin-type N-terminal cleavage/methylation domain-containing protein [Candidatus Gastranaerophilales bacterium]|nr:prepilin-type N-terminal cleavage/methylation domain-containing protein [Candidatus Gastranaerophilales bacterium]